MESDKVKEIKKALEFMMRLDLSNKLPYIDGKTIKQIAYEEIFNYINELESENERLKSKFDHIERGELVENKVVTYLKVARSGGKTLTEKALKFDELKAKIDNRTLIELPCKVGDKVYAPHWHFGEWDEIVPYQITNVTVTQNKKLEWVKKYRAMEVRNGKTIDWQLNFSFDEIGQKVFLTKAEAEKKLKELKDERL